MESHRLSIQTKKKRLISYRAWIMILVMAVIASLRRVHGADLNYMAGKFLGTVLIIAAIWVIVTLIVRQISQRKAATRL